MTDDEYFWEPVTGCWSVRNVDGVWLADWRLPPPSPAPVTTIAWRLTHIALPTLGMRASKHFGDGELTWETVRWPGSADEALEMLHQSYARWCNGLARLDDLDLGAPVGDREPGHEAAAFIKLVTHVNREVIHHGGEIGLLRDLYRAGFTTT